LGLDMRIKSITERDPEEITGGVSGCTSSALMSERDREEMKELVKMAEDIMKRGDSKLNALMSLLDGIKEEKGSKVIIFTEYKDTLEYVRRKLLDEGWPENSILKLSSDETVDERKFTDIRRSFERDPWPKFS